MQGLLLEGARYTAPCFSYLTGSGNDDEHSIVSGVEIPPFGPYSSTVISWVVQLDEVSALLFVVEMWKLLTERVSNRGIML